MKKRAAPPSISAAGGDDAAAPPRKRQRRSGGGGGSASALQCVPFSHPGPEDKAFGISPRDSFLVSVGSEKKGVPKTKDLKCPAWTLSEGDQRYVIQHRGRAVAFDKSERMSEGKAEELRCWAEYSGPAQLIVNGGRPKVGYAAAPTRVSSKTQAVRRCL